MFIYEDERFNEILPYIKGKNVNLQSFKDGGVILINEDNNNLDVNIGDKLKANFKNSKDKYTSDKKLEAENSIDLNIIGKINSNKLPNIRGLGNKNIIHLIVSKDFYNKNKNILFENKKYDNYSIELDFNFLNKEARKKTLEEMKLYANEIGGVYIDNYGQIEQLQDNVLGISIMIYIAIFLTMFIGAINIINNKNISISLRKKEIGTLLAIGIQKRDLKKIIIMEGIIQWFISSVIGGVISFIILKCVFIGLQYTGVEVMYTRVDFIIILIIGVMCILVINLISSIIPLRSFKKFDATEMIRNEE